MAENPPTFRVGQFVTWNKRLKQRPDFVKAMYGLGDGPFKVLEAGIVYVHCTCGYEVKPTWFSGHDSLCLIDSRNVLAVGHPQLVAIQTVQGKIWLSGAWLEPF